MAYFFDNFIPSHLLDIRKICQELGIYRTCFPFLPQELDLVEVMTETAKSRRTLVEDRYRDLVEAIYQNREELVMEVPPVDRDGRTEAASAQIRVIRL